MKWEIRKSEQFSPKFYENISYATSNTGLPSPAFITVTAFTAFFDKKNSTKTET